MPKSKIIIVREPGGFLSARRVGLSMSVLAKRFGDPAFSELVLAHDALGIDPQKDIYAVPAHSATWVG